MNFSAKVISSYSLLQYPLNPDECSNKSFTAIDIATVNLAWKKACLSLKHGGLGLHSCSAGSLCSTCPVLLDGQHTIDSIENFNLSA